jgi:ribosomal protein L40E
MIVCPNCNHQNPDGATQCEACYTPLPTTTSCPNCGAGVQADATFCGQCGFNLQPGHSHSEATPIGTVPLPDLPDLPDLPEVPSETLVVSPVQSNPAAASASLLPPTVVGGQTPDVSSPAPDPWSVSPSTPAMPDPMGLDPAAMPSNPMPDPMGLDPASMSGNPMPDPMGLDPASMSGNPMPDPMGLDPAAPPTSPPMPEPMGLDPTAMSSNPMPDPMASAPAASPTPPPMPDPMPDPMAASGVAKTQLQQQTCRFLHVQTNTLIELPPNILVIHMGKPNDQIPPDIDVSGFPNSEIVSRVHADVRVEGDAFYIEDVGSANGTYVNHTPLLRGNRHRLRAGDRVSLGKGDLVTFLFQVS